MHPTLIDFKDYRCFKDEWSGFDEFQPINVIIGRNNTGFRRFICAACPPCWMSPLVPAQFRKPYSLILRYSVRSPMFSSLAASSRRPSEISSARWM